MNYYKLGINPASKKWKGYMNLSSFLLDDKGNELSGVKLSAIQEKFNGVLYFDITSQGKIPPVTPISSRFLAFNDSVFVQMILTLMASSQYQLLIEIVI